MKVTITMYSQLKQVTYLQEQEVHIIN